MPWIEVTRIPKGPAPEDKRKALIGCIFPAVEYPAGIPKVDFTTGQLITNTSGGFLVLRETALITLEEKDEHTASWFREHAPTEGFVFAADEVQIVNSFEIFF